MRGLRTSPARRGPTRTGQAIDADSVDVPSELRRHCFRCGEDVSKERWKRILPGTFLYAQCGICGWHCLRKV